MTEEIDFLNILLWIVLPLGAIYLFVAFIVLLQVYSFCVCRMVHVDSPNVSPTQRQNFYRLDAWAKANGFRFVGIYRFQALVLAAWESPEKSSLLGQYLNMKGCLFEIDTYFDNHITLNTGNVRDGIMIPFPPGCYVQQFPNMNIEEIWKLHLDAVQCLREHDVTLTPYKPEIPWDVKPSEESDLAQPTSVEVVQNGSIRTQGRYVRSLWFWFFRWPLWYYCRRYFWVNKTIREQIDMGRLDPPEGLPVDYEERFITWPPQDSF